VYGPAGLIWLLFVLFFLEKVYFIGCIFDVKLQADNHVRWDVAERLNRKHKTNKWRKQNGI
jgi:hypothetical protein